MIHIDLCKLRMGDVVFSLHRAPISLSIAAGTGSLTSHAAIVVYPDIWFETNGLGSGFRLMRGATCYRQPSGARNAIVGLDNVRLVVLRPSGRVDEAALLAAIADNIILRYPQLIEFLPLMVPFKFFPRLSDRLVRKVLGAPLSGGYCSQMVFRILQRVYGLEPGRGEHISPSILKSTLKRRGARRILVDVGDDFRDLPSNPDLDSRYQSFVDIGEKLSSFQYHHDRKSFEAALAKTSEETGQALDPANYDIEVEKLRAIITKPRYFSLHRNFWPDWYS